MYTCVPVLLLLLLAECALRCVRHLLPMRRHVPLLLLLLLLLCRVSLLFCRVSLHVLLNDISLSMKARLGCRREP